MKLQKLYRSPPNRRHLLWALPLGVLICAAMWWFEVGLFNFSGLSRGSRPEIEYFYAVSLQNYIVSALVGSISILVANWSRTLWPPPPRGDSGVACRAADHRQHVHTHPARRLNSGGGEFCVFTAAHEAQGVPFAGCLAVPLLRPGGYAGRPL